MNPWHILEIEPTSNQRAIKQAYALKLKQLIPDEQPIEFQQLKTAFDAALAWAKKGHAIDEPPFEEIAEFIIEEIYLPSTEVTTENNEPTHFHQLTFSEQLQELADTSDIYWNLSAWQALTSQIENWSIEEYMNNAYIIQLFLVGNYLWLEKTIIQHLFQVFDLAELKERIGQNSFVSQEFIQMKKQIYQVPPFSFTIAEKIPAKQRKRYFELRFLIYLKLSDTYSNEPTIEELLQECTAIFNADADLFNLQMLHLLDMFNGQLPTQDTQAKFLRMLEQAETLDYNQTTLFLAEYFTRMTAPLNKPTQTSQARWQPDKLLIPEALYRLLLGFTFYNTAQYSQAFKLWQEIDLQKQIVLREQLAELSQHLAKEMKKSYRRLKRKIKKATESEKTKSQKKVLFTIGIVIALIAFYRTATTPVPNESVTQASSGQENTRRWVSRTLAMQFVQYFYLTNNVEKKESFIENNIGTIKIKKMLEPLVHQDTQIYPNEADIRYDYDKFEASDYEIMPVYYGEELICLLKIDIRQRQCKVTGLYGPKWQPIPDRLE